MDTPTLVENEVASRPPNAHSIATVALHQGWNVVTIFPHLFSSQIINVALVYLEWG